MLDAPAVLELHRALSCLERLIANRLEERRAFSMETTGLTCGELLQRPLGSEGEGGEGLPDSEQFVGEGPLAQVIREYHLDVPEILILLTALAPEVDEKFLVYYQHLTDRPEGRGCTGEVIRNLIARTFFGRLHAAEYLSPDRPLRQLQMLQMEPGLDGWLTGQVRLHPGLRSWLLGRSPHPPETSLDFPARKLTTLHTRNRLILPETVKWKIGEVIDRIRSQHQILIEWGFDKHHDNAGGYSVLMQGPSGTGKTLSSAVIGRETGMTVYRVDLSLLLSRWVGDVEKGLSRLFDAAESQNWLLFFDEADSIFSSRVNIQEGRDVYANQQVSYLLQRLECFRGVTILASNSPDNIDRAFLRRIHTQIHFPEPNQQQREQLWQSVIPPELPLADDVDLSLLASRYPLTGGAIRNVIFHAAYRTAAHREARVSQKRLLEGIQAEYEKTGRSFSKQKEAV